MLFLTLLALDVLFAAVVGWWRSSMMSAAVALLAPWPPLLLLLAHRFTHPSWLLRGKPEEGLPDKVLGKAKKWYAGSTRNPRDDLGIDYTEVEVERTGSDGKPYVLRGWLMLSEEAKSKERAAIRTLLLGVHGGGRDRRAFMRHTPIFLRAGVSVLLFDCRNHGISDGCGRGLSFGLRESEDVEHMAEYGRKQLGFNTVVACGTSQGAVSCILAAARQPENIHGVVAENPYHSVPALVRGVLNGVLGPVPRLLRGVKHSFISAAASVLLWYLGSHPERRHGDAFRVVHLIAPRPLLLMHGTGDVLVPHSHSAELYERAKSPKALWEAEGAEHTALQNQYPEEWERRVLQLLEEVHYQARVRLEEEEEAEAEWAATWGEDIDADSATSAAAGKKAAAAGASDGLRYRS